MNEPLTASEQLRTRLSGLPKEDLASAYAGLLSKYQRAEKAGKLVEVQPARKQAVETEAHGKKTSRSGHIMSTIGIVGFSAAAIVFTGGLAAPAVAAGIFATGGALCVAGIARIEKGAKEQKLAGELRTKAVEQAKARDRNATADDFGIDPAEAREAAVVAAEVLAEKTSEPLIADPTDTQLIELANQTRTLAEAAGPQTGRGLGRSAGQGLE